MSQNKLYKEKGYLAKRKILKQSNFLELTPIVKYPYETGNDGNIIILVPRFTSYLGARLLQPRLKNPYFKLSLDEAGSQVWLLADGHTTVKEICRKAEEKLGEKIKPSHQRVTTFLSGLYMKELITFVEILK